MRGCRVVALAMVPWATGWVTQGACRPRVRCVEARKSLIEEIEAKGGRVTATDVAGVCGSVSAGERELLALAARLADEETKIEAMEDGRLVFDYGPRAAKRLAKVDRGERWLGRWRRAKPALATTGKVAFGTGLFVSMAVWSVLLLALQQASMSEGDTGSVRSTSYTRSIWFDLMLWSSWDEPRHVSRRDEMHFLEAVYSYVFGDGDPNADIDRRSLEAAARVVRENDGVVVADQLVPALREPPETDQAADAAVLSTVVALGGRVELVDDQCVYVFDDPGVSTDDSGEVCLVETPRRFSRASSSQLVAAGVLGAVNLLGASALFMQLSSANLAAVFGPKKIAAVRAVCVPLAGYAVTYNLAPIVRALRNARANAAITTRNDRRKRWQRRLDDPDRADPKDQLDPQAAAERKTALRRRLAAANRALKRRLRPNDDVAYSTAATRQPDYVARAAQDQLASFDRRLAPPDENQP